MKIRPQGAEFRAGGRTDKNKLFAILRTRLKIARPPYFFYILQKC
jgi:hypothetical protein